MSFSISQHSSLVPSPPVNGKGRDESLLSKIIDYLGCGNIEKAASRPTGSTFVVYKFSDICQKIIPFFQNYPLQGVKLLDYNDFVKIADLMKNKTHLTPEGLEQIRQIKCPPGNWNE